MSKWLAGRHIADLPLFIVQMLCFFKELTKQCFPTQTHKQENSNKVPQY